MHVAVFRQSHKRIADGTLCVLGTVKRAAAGRPAHVLRLSRPMNRLLTPAALWKNAENHPRTLDALQTAYLPSARRCLMRKRGCSANSLSMGNRSAEGFLRLASHTSAYQQSTSPCAWAAVNRPRRLPEGFPRQSYLGSSALICQRISGKDASALGMFLTLSFVCV